jgi:hypothetical protein
MAGRGPAPKQHRQRQRDERRRQADQTVVHPDDEVRGPTLPQDVSFGPSTIAFYETIRRAPQAQAYEATDWLIITDVLLPLHDAFTTGTRKSAATAAEIRQIMASLGATVTDRLRAKITIDRGNAPTPEASADRAKQADLQARMGRLD